MGEDVKEYDEIFNILEVYADCDSVCRRDYERIRHVIE